MNKIQLTIAAIILSLTSVLAQNEKNGLCVEVFSHNSEIGTNWVENLRNNIIQGIIKTGRVEVLDVSTLNDLPTVEAERLDAIKDAVEGINYVLKGHYNTLKTVKKTDSKGNVSYETNSNYTLTLVDADTRAILNTKTFDDKYYSGDTENESIVKAIEESIDNMRHFVADNFKMEAIVKALDQIDQKKGAKTIYITLGKSAGVQPGQKFDIYKEIDIAGEKATKQIGTATAQEVVSDGLTLCKVNKGGVEIMAEFNANSKLTVISGKQSAGGIFGKMNDAMDSVLK